jgi:hypothetical protein
MRPYGLIASVLGVLIAADAGDDAAKTDLERFQGHWSLISAERDWEEDFPRGRQATHAVHSRQQVHSSEERRDYFRRYNDARSDEEAERD